MRNSSKPYINPGVVYFSLYPSFSGWVCAQPEKLQGFMKKQNHED
jgi:hypothetical protein